MCGGVFDFGWSDDEARAELKETFGNIPIEECAIVCDDCYQAMIAIQPPQKI